MEMRTKIFFISCRIACVTDYYCHGLFDRYSGPNTGNVHIIADLFAEVIGILAQSKWVHPKTTKSLQCTFFGLLHILNIHFDKKNFTKLNMIHAHKMSSVISVA